MNYKIFLFISIILIVPISFSCFAMNHGGIEGQCTPKINRRRTSLIETPESAKKRRTVHTQDIRNVTIAQWPQLWVAHGCDVEFAKNLSRYQLKNGSTVLSNAMRCHGNRGIEICERKIECITDLLKAGNGFLPKDNKAGDGYTALHLWVLCPHTRQLEAQAVGKALSETVLPSLDQLCDNQKNTPLHLVCRKGLINFEKFKALADWGIPLDAQNSRGQTILHVLAQAPMDYRHDKEKILDYIVHSRRILECTVDLKDVWGATALIQAVCSGDVWMLKWLLERGNANTDIVDQDKNAPLHYAAQNLGRKGLMKCSRAIIKNLLNCGACKNLKNNNNLMPYDCVPENKRSNVVRKKLKVS